MLAEKNEDFDLSLYGITKFYLYSYIEFGKYISDVCCPDICSLF